MTCGAKKFRVVLPLTAASRIERQLNAVLSSHPWANSSPGPLENLRPRARKPCSKSPNRSRTTAISRELFHELAARLHHVAHFDYLNLVLHDPERQVMRLHILETLQPVLTQVRVGRELPVSESPSGRVVETQQPFVVSDLDAESSFPDGHGTFAAREYPLVLLDPADHRTTTSRRHRLRQDSNPITTTPTKWSSCSKWLARLP